MGYQVVLPSGKHDTFEDATKVVLTDDGHLRLKNAQDETVALYNTTTWVKTVRMDS